MIVRKQKRSTTVNTISWEAALEDDRGIQFAAMSGSLDATHPLGQISFTVHNPEIYQANATEAKRTYADFVREITETAMDFVGSAINVEGDDIAGSDEQMPMEEV